MVLNSHRFGSKRSETTTITQNELKMLRKPSQNALFHEILEHANESFRASGWTTRLLVRVRLKIPKNVFRKNKSSQKSDLSGSTKSEDGWKALNEFFHFEKKFKNAALTPRTATQALHS